MCHKSLKRNDTKTEMLLISTKQLATKLNCHTLLIGEHQVTPATVVRNIGVIMDTHASMEAHVKTSRERPITTCTKLAGSGVI